MANVTLDSPTQSITAKIGETIDVFVAENPTTGYQWTAETSGGAADIASSTFEAPSAPTPGAPGRRHVRVIARRAGSATVRLKHARSWETSGAADERTLTVTVV
jgi:predicted secreted protein